jgi:hypothetical protein
VIEPATALHLRVQDARQHIAAAVLVLSENRGLVTI